LETYHAPSVAKYYDCTSYKMSVNGKDYTKEELVVIKKERHQQAKDAGVDIHLERRDIGKFLTSYSFADNKLQYEGQDHNSAIDMSDFLEGMFVEQLQSLDGWFWNHVVVPPEAEYHSKLFVSLTTKQTTQSKKRTASKHHHNKNTKKQRGQEASDSQNGTYFQVIIFQLRNSQPHISCYFFQTHLVQLVLQLLLRPARRHIITMTEIIQALL
jgi:hypothetical protein